MPHMRRPSLLRRRFDRLWGNDENFHLTADSGHSGQTAVGREEDRICELGQGHVCGVIGRHVVAQFPAPFDQTSVVETLDREISEVLDRPLSSRLGDESVRNPLPQCREDFDVDQRRGEKFLVEEAGSYRLAGPPVVAERRQHNTRINDYHGPPGSS